MEVFTMLRLTDTERTFDVLDELRRQMERVWTDFDDAHGFWRAPTRGRNLATAAWPAVNVYDQGDKIALYADVPGVAVKDIALTLHDGVLTISGERKLEVPQGFTA